MAKEIERKFMVNGAFKHLAHRNVPIVQGYLSSVPERNVRVRILGDKGFITIKGVGSESGMSRFEWEKEIPKQDAEELLKICEPGIIDKTRHYILHGKHTFEVDEFHGDNAGLVIAEIELESEDEVFEKPDWLGAEVTGNKQYYNAWLSRQPYNSW
jgi:adenylate cyclase